MNLDQLTFLVGFMGCGKTFWSKRLSTLTGIHAYDLDELIEVQHEDTIANLFFHHGESGFRTMERAALLQTTLLQPAIIATGGGAACFFDNMDWMNDNGRTIYLKTPASLLADRLKHEIRFRPLLQSVNEHQLEAHIQELLSRRESYYEKATIVLEQTDATLPFFETMLLEAATLAR